MDRGTIVVFDEARMIPSRLTEILRGRKVIYITVKNADYIRTLQFRRVLLECALESLVISSEKAGPISRVFDLRRRLKSIDLSYYDVIIVGFLPQLIWKYIRKKAGRQERLDRPVFVADFFLSLYDTIVLDRKYIGTGNPLSRYLESLDRKVLEDADYVLTDTKADADFFGSEILGYRRSDIEPFYLEAESSIYKASPEDEKTYLATEEAEYLQDKRTFEVLYFGTGLPLQGIDVVIEAYLILARKYEGRDIRMTYIGGLDDASQHIVERYSCIDIMPWLCQEELAARIRRADLCLAGHFAYGDGKQDRTIPGKAFIYEAMNKKMILGDSRANHEIFIEDENHHFVRRGDSEALSKAIETFGWKQ